MIGCRDPIFGGQNREECAVKGPRNYEIFETANGFVAIVWNSKGITNLCLPAKTAAAAERALLKRAPAAVRATPPAPVAAVIDAVKRYFGGEKTDFSGVVVDLGELDPFFLRIYDAVRRLGWGQTTTYGSVAKELGVGPEAARDVGKAMATNPVPLIIPCHRVLAAGGKIGGFSAPGGANSKRRMLEIEGVVVQTSEDPRLDQAAFNF
jgi:methylated-DNA-[protein]-cysteine S-methyltransferase